MIKDEDTAYGEWRQEQLDAKRGPTLQEQLDRVRHIGNHMRGPLTCDDGTRWHPVELLSLVMSVESHLGIRGKRL